jgi:hypothetical protein
MKWLIILFLLFVLVAIVAVRYRRQIQTAIYMYKMFRKMRQASKGTEKQIETKQSQANIPLVRCVGCGNWVAETDVLKMGNKIAYCSTACIEKKVKVG